MKAALLLFLFFIITPTLVLSWGAIGHSAIANTAWELMNAQAKQKAYNYLPANATMQSIASLADYYAESSAGKWSAHLHYVNMNKGQTEFEMSVDCVNGCVVSAILNNTAQLIDAKFWAKLVDEPNPFEFLVHFVGDVHQPLHVGWGYDEGGNTVTCYLFGKKTELHAVWDTGMIEYYNSDWYDWSEHLLDIINKNSSLIPYYTQSMDPSQWADESFDYVLNDVYNFNVSGMAKSIGAPYEIDLGTDYYNHNIVIVTERLVASSIRLATLLNKIFG